MEPNDLAFVVFKENGLIYVQVVKGTRVIFHEAVAEIGCYNDQLFHNFIALSSNKRQYVRQALQLFKTHIGWTPVDGKLTLLNDRVWKQLDFKIMGSKVFKVYQADALWYVSIRHRYSGEVLFWHAIGGNSTHMPENPYNLLQPHEKKLVRTALYLFGMTPNQLNIRFNLTKLYERKYTSREMKMLRQRQHKAE